MAELTSMNLFQHLPYAPTKSFQWIASEQEFVQICGYLTIARLLMKRGDMAERVENEFLDQAVCAFLSGDYHIQRAVMTALRRYIEQGESQAFSVCRRVESYAHSSIEAEQKLYALVQTEVSEPD